MLMISIWRLNHLRRVCDVQPGGDLGESVPDGVQFTILRTKLTGQQTSKGYFLPMKTLLDWCERTTPCVIVKHCISCEHNADNSACFSSAQPSR